MASFVRAVRNNKYKVFAATVTTLYASDTIAFRYRQKLEREMHLRQAKLIGEEPLGVHASPRRLTIVLNPSSNNGKAKLAFNDDVAPILHLAGIDYGIVETTHPGHAKELVAGMDLSVTDGIVVCGGGGLLHDVVTGLLRREDADVARRKALGLIPLGVENTTSLRLLGKEPLRTQSFYRCKAALALAKAETTRQLDVFEVCSEEGKLYSVESIRYGVSGVWNAMVISTPWPLSSLIPDTYAMVKMWWEQVSFPVSLSTSSTTDGDNIHEGHAVDVALRIGGPEDYGRARVRVVKSTAGQLAAINEGRRAPEDTGDVDSNVTLFNAVSGSLAFKADDSRSEAHNPNLMVDGEALPSHDLTFQVLPSHIAIYA